MSGSGDNFGEDIAKLENVRLLTSTEYLREYTGVLAETNERVRIITLAPELADIDAAVSSFSQVVDTWHNASANANILTIRNRDTEPYPWIAVPDDDGETLATVQADLAPEAVETVISETAGALRTLGLYNTVHGHLSPDDIHFPDATDQTETLSVHVGGFGLEAAIQDAVGEFESTAYTAPELLDNPGQSTERADVYGLAAVTYFALTGHPPVEGDDLDQAIRDGPSSLPSAYDDAIPADLDSVVMQALSTLPEDRYDSPYTFGRAFLSTFAPDDFRPNDTGEESVDETETVESAEPANAASDEGGDDAPSDKDEGSTSSEDTDETRITRRAAAGLLCIGALGGAGWYLSRGQLTAADPTEETAADPAEETATPDPPAEPSASISVSPADPSVGDEVTFSANESTTGEEVSLETYEWALGADAAFAEDDSTRTDSFSESGEQTVQLRITDSRGRTATATTTITVAPLADGAPMFRYNAANTGTSSAETGPQTSIGQQWSYQTGSYVVSSPAVVDGTVYIGSRDGSVYALSADDGTEQWSFQTGDDVVSSPAVVDGTVYVGSRDNNVYALSADDGTEQWSFQTGSTVESSPAVINDAVYVGSTDNNVYALSTDDGTEQWTYQTRSTVDSSPAVVDGTVYVGSWDNSVYALSAEDGTQQWAYETGDAVYSSPAVIDHTVYVGSHDRNVYALSANDGTEQWSYQTRGQVWSSPAVVAGTVYVGSRGGDLYALSADDGTEQWIYQTAPNVEVSPTVVNSTVYFGSRDGSVYALSVDDGTEQWSFQTGGLAESSPPVVVDGTVYIGSVDDNMYALSGE